MVGCGRNEIALERLRNEFPDSTFLACDVSDEGSVEDFVEEGLSLEGTPDLLINNAAIITETAPLWEVSAEDFDHLMAVNVSGTANVLRHLIPHMIEQRSGVIANLSSGWGRSTSPEVAPYCASKWAIEGLTQALAQELPEGLAAVAVNPGIINTEMLQTCFGEDDCTAYPDPETWVQSAAPFFLNLNASDNGRALTCP